MRVGVLGGGQLGRMLALAGAPLGLRFRFLDPSPDAVAGHVGELIVAPYDDAAALRKLADGAAVVTYEFENVPRTAVHALRAAGAVLPPPAALEAGQDRLREKLLFQRLEIPTPAFWWVHSRAELDEAVQRVRLPAVLKTRRFGYDGKGQFVLRDAADLERAWNALGRVPLTLEAFVPFERELSIVAVRGRDGAIAFYPLVENTHREGILRLSLAPAANVAAVLQQQAESAATQLLTALEYVGVLAIEFFEHDGRLLANEFAPRVHNSGHWTIEGAATSQFENHLRAILGLPLGATAPRGRCAMLNLIGAAPPPDAVLSIPGAHLHLYGKTPQPSRKLGHVTLCESSADELQRKLELLRPLCD